ncbi:hypothetical protein [Vreelandella venusta]|uniref:hypothetical protein n=1 Tax=Vreelandella venusta TaxID=44935 RepID=UPI001173C6E4|nr:hypothetical protein [Halomonas venusta]GEK52318.1 hypothetical protein HVE01_30390 [Halomonas venusta]
MNQNYTVSEHYEVGGKAYQLEVAISNETMSLQGSFHKPGDSTWYNVERLEIPSPSEQEAGGLIDFVALLPADVRMPMHALIAHLYTVYNFLYPKKH